MEFGSEVIKVLDYLAEKLGMTIDWSNKNVMPYVEQICSKYIKWEISTSIAWIVMDVIVIASLLAVLYVGNKKCWNEDLLEFFTTVIAFAIVATVFVIGYQVFDIIQCCVFPEKQIYEYITYLIKK